MRVTIINSMLFPSKCIVGLANFLIYNYARSWKKHHPLEERRDMLLAQKVFLDVYLKYS